MNELKRENTDADPINFIEHMEEECPSDYVLSNELTTATSISSVALKEPMAEWWSTSQAMTMSTIMLVFFLIVLGMMTHLIKFGKDPEVILKIFGMILIIAVSSFLVVTGYNSEQIASVIGLLGTIAGYLLGKNGSSNSK